MHALIIPQFVGLHRCYNYDVEIIDLFKYFAREYESTEHTFGFMVRCDYISLIRASVEIKLNFQPFLL